MQPSNCKYYSRCNAIPSPRIVASDIFFIKCASPAISKTLEFITAVRNVNYFERSIRSSNRSTNFEYSRYVCMELCNWSPQSEHGCACWNYSLKMERWFDRFINYLPRDFPSRSSTSVSCTFSNFYLLFIL